MKTYAVADIFDTIQGEGGRAGCRSVFLRLAGCNLWNGRHKDRDGGKGACALWCDTDFLVRERLTSAQIVARLGEQWPAGSSADRWAVVSGGEPFLQLDVPLLTTLTEAGWHVAVETNGRTAVDARARSLIDWITVSPKLNRDGSFVDIDESLTDAEELKVVLPGVSNRSRALLAQSTGWSEEVLCALATDTRFGRYYVQPQDPEIYASPFDEVQSERKRNELLCLAWIKRHPQWRLSVQTHKTLDIP